MNPEEEDIPPPKYKPASKINKSKIDY